MTEKTKNKVIVIMISFMMLLFSIMHWLEPDIEFSVSERRKLAQFPELSGERITSGKFMGEFESYVVDQFPFRDGFRGMKTLMSQKIFGQKDQHGIYISGDHICKMEYPLNPESLDRVSQRFRYIYNKYMEETDVKLYFSIIPDKNYFLAESGGYLRMDYEELFAEMQKNTGYMTYIPIADLLEADDFYKTDIHWRQEKIVDIAERIGAEMGITLHENHEICEIKQPFYGNLSGQYALPTEGEKLCYLTNETLKNCEVFDYENQRRIQVYDMEKAEGRDPYEMFLSGSLALVTITNPGASSDKELVLFRDSFGSSIAPLFAGAYKKITLIDIRYIHPDLLEQYIQFKDQDVLFLYSTLSLNHGEIFK